MPDPTKKSWRELLQDANYGLHPQIMKDEITQYFHPEKDVFPKTDLRPTSLTGNQYDWRSLQGKYPDMDLPGNIAGKSVDELQYPYKISPDRVPVGNVTQKRLWYPPGTDVGAYMGLGTSNQSIGLGPSKDPYLSVYDKWDFAGEPIRDYLTKGGTPYNVYDRIPIQLENGKFPKTIYTNPNHGKDIDLPTEPVKGIGPSKKVVR